MRLRAMQFVALVVATALGAVSARAAEGDAPKAADEGKTVKVAREVMEKNAGAVVHVRLVLKIKVTAGGREAGSQERKAEVNGTVIDPSGLTIISNAATDPASMINLGEDNPQIKIDASVTDVKLVLADGKEYPAKVVLRDKDLDLAFVRPDEKGLKLPSIELKKAAAPQVLDEVITLSRLDNSSNREPAVCIGRILSVIKKPRVRYVTMSISDTGCPAFDASGNLLGLVLMRAPLDANMSSINLMMFMPAILPADDILEAKKQVPPPKDEKEKPAAEKPDAAKAPATEEKKAP